MVKYFEDSKYPCDIMVLSYFDFQSNSIFNYKGEKE